MKRHEAPARLPTRDDESTVIALESVALCRLPVSDYLFADAQSRCSDLLAAKRDAGFTERPGWLTPTAGSPCADLEIGTFHWVNSMLLIPAAATAESFITSDWGSFQTIQSCPAGV